jgi:hypothetical protein
MRESIGVIVFFLAFPLSCSFLVLQESSETLPPKENKFFFNFYGAEYRIHYWDDNAPSEEYMEEFTPWEFYGGFQFGWRRGLTRHLDFHIKAGYSPPFVFPVGGGLKIGSKHLGIGIGVEVNIPGALAYYGYPIISVINEENIILSISPRFVFYHEFEDWDTKYFWGGNIGILLGKKLKIGSEIFIFKYEDPECPYSSCYTNGIPNIIGLSLGLIF